MITESEALFRILARTRALPTRSLPLLRAVGFFAARELTATVALPPFDNSAMDGYAVLASSCRLGARLRVIGEQPAGADRHLALREGEAIRILTGGPMPAGADAVIMQEDVSREGDEVILHEAVVAGEFVRRRGGDMTEGQKLVSSGDPIRAQTAGLLAAQGLASVEVGGQVRAVIISTGDELAPLGAPLQPGQIYDSNSVLLQALLEQCGVDVVEASHCPDEAREIEAAMRRGMQCDVMIITGGVSVGARDLVKPSLNAIGATLDLWRVAVKPGKPFLFGRAENCAIFGLPGNPVSAFVTFLLFVRPAILKLMGANEAALSLTSQRARLREEVRNDGDRPHYLRGLLQDGVFSPVGRQESHALFGLARANALLRLAPGENVPADAAVTALTWS